MPVFAKMISYLVRKVLYMAKTHVIVYSLGCCGICRFGDWHLLSVHPVGR